MNASLLLFALRKKLARLELGPLRKDLLPLVLLTLFAGFMAWESWQLWEKVVGHATLVRKIGAVFVPAGIAGGIYLFGALACKIQAAGELIGFMLAKFKRRT